MSTMIKRIIGVGAFTVLSRILGFVRDMLMARYLGAGMVADAFFIAFKLPNFFRRLFAEGAFSAGFVPLFSRRLAEGDIKEAARFAEETFSVFMPMLIGFFTLMQLAMPWVMWGLTGGFDGDSEKFTLSLELSRTLFAYLPLVSLLAFFAGCLNGLDRFMSAAAAPILLNICMIIALLTTNGTDGSMVARWLAISISAAGAVQLLWLAIALRRTEMKLQWRMPRITDGTRELVQIVLPAAIGAGVMQINLLVDLLLAARFLPEGSVSWLFYADRLNQMPVGIIGVAVGTVLLPTISRALGRGDDRGAELAMNGALRYAMLLTLPAATALLLIPDELIASLFERGEFNGADTAATAYALMFFAIGLPAYVVSKILTPAYHARKDTRTPVRYAIIAVGINLILNLLLIGPLQHAGLALATAIAAWSNVAMLYGGLHGRDLYKIKKPLIIPLVKTILACVLMGASLYGLTQILAPAFQSDGLERVLALGMLVGGGLLSYLLSILLLKLVHIADIKKLVKGAT